MRNHDAAFAELKSYYNDITKENLNVIKGQKQDIENLQASLLTNSKQITEIKAKNKQAEGPLKQNRKLRDDMKYALRQHAKDQMSLANLKLKITSLRDRIRRLEKEQEEIDARFSNVNFIRKFVILNFSHRCYKRRRVLNIDSRILQWKLRLMLS